MESYALGSKIRMAINNNDPEKDYYKTPLMSGYITVEGINRLIYSMMYLLHWMNYIMCVGKLEVIKILYIILDLVENIISQNGTETEK